MKAKAGTPEIQQDEQLKEVRVAVPIVEKAAEDSAALAALKDKLKKSEQNNRALAKQLDFAQVVVEDSREAEAAAQIKAITKGAKGNQVCYKSSWKHIFLLHKI